MQFSAVRVFASPARFCTWNFAVHACPAFGDGDERLVTTILLPLWVRAEAALENPSTSAKAQTRAAAAHRGRTLRCGWRLFIEPFIVGRDQSDNPSTEGTRPHVIVQRD
jgi:hypothetical protein